MNALSCPPGACAAVLLSLLGTLATAAPAAADVVAVEAGGTWKYEASGTDLGTAWRDTAYNDSSWAGGDAPLGYGEVFIVTTVPFGDTLNKHRTTYFRVAFDMPEDPAGIQAILLQARWDDGFVAYMNGTEVARGSMPAGPVSYGTFALDHEALGFEAIDLSAWAGEVVAGTNTFAVEVHQASPASSDLVLDMDLRIYTSPPSVTRGPYLQSVGWDRATICWRTDRFTGSSLSYGLDPGLYTGGASDPAPALDHTLTVTGLAPDTRHYYAIGTGAGFLDGGDAAHHFDTMRLPGAAGPMRLWIVGDPGTGSPGQAAVRDAYESFNAGGVTDGWITLGDNAYSTGTDAEYQSAFFDPYDDMLRTHGPWMSRGNHDLPHPPPNPDYLSIFSLPTGSEFGGVASGTESYYAFDLGNAHFICLDSFLSDREPGGAMLNWLAADMAENPREWLIAFWHHPPYTHGSHNSDDPFDSEGRMEDMRENVLPMLEDAGVDLVLCGHSHAYERSPLLDGHYGSSETYEIGHAIQPGDSRWDGDGPYVKPPGIVPHAGTVYVVMGVSGSVAGGALDHPALPFTSTAFGSLVLDVDGTRLDVRFLTDGGVVADSFTIVKSVNDVAGAPGGPSTRLGAARPNPFVSDARLDFTLARPGQARVEVFDLGGRRVRTLVDGVLEAGAHEARWDGRSDAGARMPAGLYWVALRAEGRTATSRVVLAR